MERKIRIRRPNGEVEYIDPKDFQPSPIINMDLSEDLLTRINWVYRQLKEVINATMEKIQTEEQFQILFMRDDDPEKDVTLYEDIARTYKIALKRCQNDDLETKKTIFSIIMFYIVDSLSAEEKEREDIKNIINIFNSLQGMENVIKESIDSEEEEEDNTESYE